MQQRRIVHDLRSRIIAGDLLPGDQLPSRAELVEHFDVTPVTMQRAMDWLREDGFIRADPQGTFVTDRPPHLHRFGLVFPCRRDGKEFANRWYFVLDQEAKRLSETGPASLRVFFSGNPMRTRPEDTADLEHHILCQCLAGLIVVDPSSLAHGTPLLRETELPRVAVSSSPRPGLPTINLGKESFVRQALDYVVERGCRRLGVVTTFGIWRDEGDLLEAAAAKRGLDLRQRWVQAVPLDETRFGRNVGELLMHHPDDRPEALLVSDDNLLEHVAEGLADAGVRCPDDLELIAHCNFPWPTPSCLPVTRLGYDARELLDVGLKMLRRLAAGETVPGEVEVPARFEGDLRTDFDVSPLHPITRKEPRSCRPAADALLVS